MFVEELEGANAIDRMRSVEEFDLGAVAEAEFVVEAADAGEFMGDPFVGRDAVVVSALDHERARRDERGHLGVVVGVREVPLEDLVFAGEEVAVA